MCDVFQNVIGGQFCELNTAVCCTSEKHSVRSAFKYTKFLMAEDNFKGLEAGEFSSVDIILYLCLCYDNILTPHSIRTIMRLTSASQHDKITF